MTSVAFMLEAQLKERLQVPTVPFSEEELAKEPPVQNASSPLSWLGKQPLSGLKIEREIANVLETLASSKFSSSLPQLRGKRSVVACVLGAYKDAERGDRLASVYARLLELMDEKGVSLDQVKVVAVVCAGGTPYRHYGLGDGTIEAAAQAQLYLAMAHNFILDLVPMNFSDFNSHIVKMAVGVAAVLGCKLANRDAGRSRIDAVLFGCKGTLAAAAALGTYLKRGVGRGTAGFGLVGLGTDLTQGFAGAPWVELWKEALDKFPLLAMNSKQDEAAIGGRQVLDSFVESLNGKLPWQQSASSPPPPPLPFAVAHWYDVDDGTLAARPRLGHNWYDSAFATACKELRCSDSGDLTPLAKLCIDMCGKMSRLLERRGPATACGSGTEEAALKLTYLDYGGSAEPIRMALRWGKIEFVDERIDYAEIRARRAAGKLGPHLVVPVLTVKGVQYSQSAAILRFVGRMTGLYPSEGLQQLMVDQAVEAVAEVHARLLPAFYKAACARSLKTQQPGVPLDSQQVAEMRIFLNEDVLPSKLKLLNESLLATKGPWFLGDVLSIADLVCASLVLELLRGLGPEGISPSVLDGLPTLCSHSAAVLNIPAIAGDKPKR